MFLKSFFYFLLFLSSCYILPVCSQEVQVSDDDAKQYVASMISELKYSKCEIKEIKECNETSEANVTSLQIELNNCIYDKNMLYNLSKEREMKYNELRIIVIKKYQQCLNKSEICLNEINSLKEKISSTITAYHYQLQQKDQMINSISEENRALLKTNTDIESKINEYSNSYYSSTGSSYQNTYRRSS